MTTTSRQRRDPGASGHVEARLRELATTAVTTRHPVLDGPSAVIMPCGLDERVDALVRLAAMVAMRASATSYRGIIDAALARGATTDEIIGTMISVASTVGLSRVVPATEGLALGLGYDIDAALERVDESTAKPRSPRDGC